MKRIAIIFFSLLLLPVFASATGIPNNLPVWSGSTNLEVFVGENIDVTVSVTDADNHQLTITTWLPEGASYDVSTGRFTWMPEEAGEFTARFKAHDGLGEATHKLHIKVLERANRPPEFVNFAPPLKATSTVMYEYDVEAIDPDGDTLEFSLPQSPDGMAIASSTGVISWAPTEEQAASTPYDFTVRVSDGELFAEASSSIMVMNFMRGNQLPIWSGPTHASTTVNTLLELTIAVVDPDGDTLEATTTLPNGARYDISTGKFSWTATATGTYEATFGAYDGTGTSTHMLTIEVGETSTSTENRLPVWDGPTSKSITVNNKLTFIASSTDPDGDHITVTTELPRGALYDLNTREFSWTPTSTGSFVAKFFATDGKGTSTLETNITVDQETQSPPPPPSSGGGSSGGSGGGGGSPRSGEIGPLVGQNPPPSVLPPPPAAPVGETPATPAPIVPLKPPPSVKPPQPPPVVPPRGTGGGSPQPEMPLIPPPENETPAPAERPGFFSNLVAGLFNLFDWIRLNSCLLCWLLWLLTVIAFLLYIYYTRKERGSAVPATNPEGVTLDGPPSEKVVNEYWETYSGDRE